MDILRAAGLIILALSILVTIHELGHYWAARIFKIRVEEFALFFGKKIFGFKKGDTEWRLNIIPLGGYVKISGMIDENLEEQAEGPPEPWEFRAKPIWQRLIVMLGGIVMNIILGCMIFIGHKYVVGDKFTPMENVSMGIIVNDTSAMGKLGFRTGDQILNYSGQTFQYLEQYSDPNLLVDFDKVFEVKHNDGTTEKISLPNDFLGTFMNEGMSKLFVPDMAPILILFDTSHFQQLIAAEADTSEFSIQAFRSGMRNGDRVLKVDSTPVSRYSEFAAIMGNRPNEVVELLVDRGGKEIPFRLHTKANSKIGCVANTDTLKQKINYTFGESIPKGINEAFGQVGNTLKGLRGMFSGNVNPSKSMAGPIGIAQVFNRGVQARGWEFFWWLTGMLSMVLAVMNLLPIPALDGGQVVLLLIEAVIGREIPIKIKKIIMTVGVYMVIALMAFVILNDIIKLF